MMIWWILMASMFSSFGFILSAHSVKPLIIWVAWVLMNACMLAANFCYRRLLDRIENIEKSVTKYFDANSKAWKKLLGIKEN